MPPAAPRRSYFVGFEEFVVLQGVADGFLIDEDVGQQRIGGQLGGGGAQMVEAGLQFSAVGRGDLDARAAVRI